MSSFQHSFLHSTMLSCIELKASISELYSFPFSNSKICQEREGKISKSKCKHKILLHIFTWNIIIMNFGSKHWNHLSQKPCLHFFLPSSIWERQGKKDVDEMSNSEWRGQSFSYQFCIMKSIAGYSNLLESIFLEYLCRTTLTISYHFLLLQFRSHYRILSSHSIRSIRFLNQLTLWASKYPFPWWAERTRRNICVCDLPLGLLCKHHRLSLHYHHPLETSVPTLVYKYFVIYIQICIFIHINMYTTI